LGFNNKLTQKDLDFGEIKSLQIYTDLIMSFSPFRIFIIVVLLSFFFEAHSQIVEGYFIYRLHFDSLIYVPVELIFKSTTDIKDRSGDRFEVGGRANLNRGDIAKRLRNSIKNRSYYHKTAMLNNYSIKYDSSILDMALIGLNSFYGMENTRDLFLFKKVRFKKYKIVDYVRWLRKFKKTKLIFIFDEPNLIDATDEEARSLKLFITSKSKVRIQLYD
jgi:hypothetical protein